MMDESDSATGGGGSTSGAPMSPLPAQRSNHLMDYSQASSHGEEGGDMLSGSESSGPSMSASVRSMTEKTSGGSESGDSESAEVHGLMSSSEASEDEGAPLDPQALLLSKQVAKIRRQNRAARARREGREPAEGKRRRRPSNLGYHRGGAHRTIDTMYNHRDMYRTFYNKSSYRQVRRVLMDTVYYALLEHNHGKAAAAMSALVPMHTLCREFFMKAAFCLLGRERSDGEVNSAFSMFAKEQLTLVKRYGSTPSGPKRKANLGLVWTAILQAAWNRGAFDGGASRSELALRKLVDTLSYSCGEFLTKELRPSNGLIKRGPSQIFLFKSYAGVGYYLAAALLHSLGKSDAAGRVHTEAMRGFAQLEDVLGDMGPLCAEASMFLHCMLELWALLPKHEQRGKKRVMRETLQQFLDAYGSSDPLVTLLWLRWKGLSSARERLIVRLYRHACMDPVSEDVRQQLAEDLDVGVHASEDVRMWIVRADIAMRRASVLPHEAECWAHLIDSLLAARTHHQQETKRSSSSSSSPSSSTSTSSTSEISDAMLATAHDSLVRQCAWWQDSRFHFDGVVSPRGDGDGGASLALPVRAEDTHKSGWRVLARELLEEAIIEHDMRPLDDLADVLHVEEVKQPPNASVEQEEEEVPASDSDGDGDEKKKAAVDTVHTHTTAPKRRVREVRRLETSSDSDSDDAAWRPDDQRSAHSSEDTPPSKRRRHK